MATTLMLPKKRLIVTTVCLALTRLCHCAASNANIPAIANYFGTKDVGPRQTVNDELMRFFAGCRRFVEDVEHNRTALREVELFKGSEEMEALQRKMADRLQVPRHHISPDLVEAAYFLCSYEFAIKSLHSPWCNLFDETDAQVLEYKNDLKQYWKRGYGHSINRKSSCTLFHNLFNRLEQAAEQSRSGGAVSEAVSVQVGHGETLLPLLSLLGFFRDKAPLTAASFPGQRDRSFRTGRIVPYAANMLFVLYGCHGDGPRLQFLLNETPVNFPGWEEPAPLLRGVRERYAALLQDCDFHRECDVATETTAAGGDGNRHKHEL
ncbi:multiple inositol polyphosphate phosphatase 1b [Aplochiton taeniatus]